MSKRVTSYLELIILIRKKFCYLIRQKEFSLLKRNDWPYIKVKIIFKNTIVRTVVIPFFYNYQKLVSFKKNAV